MTVEIPNWRPSLGAWPERAGTRFRVWAPVAQTVELLVEGDSAGSTRALEPVGDGCFGGWFPDIQPGALYRYRVNGGKRCPDPASRFQPAGVHGPSQVVDPGAFHWSDHDWLGPDPGDVVFYELHVGTFTSEGTFNGLAARLPDLAALGVTTIELMPIADFRGQRNWGYDGVALFAPARCYGTPDDLRRLVDTAHAIGLAVLVDVVYNHVGPDGAYLSVFSPYYFSERQSSPWGAGVNLAGDESRMVRAFFIENALHWLHEYHLDGLRLDATHALTDEGPRPFVAELASRARRCTGGRRILAVAEDRRNLAVMITPKDTGGWGLDAVWADDFHHQVRRLLAGDSEGYYADYSGTTADLADTIRQGWFYKGQRSRYLDAARGTEPTGIPHARFVVCLQNHDQVGNRAFGDRLHHVVDLAAYRAASMLLLTVPETPLLFMGQEWAASAPFLYFTDHEAALGRLVTEGRRREFQSFAAFSDSAERVRIPDPQADATFRASTLDWQERSREPHASTERLYQALIALRRLPRVMALGSFEVAAVDEDTIALSYHGREGGLVAVVRLRGAGAVALGASLQGDRGAGPAASQGFADAPWRCLLTTEDPSFAVDPAPPVIDLRASMPIIHFRRPSGVLLASFVDVDRPRIGDV